MTIFVTAAQERHTLERALTECKRRLAQLRAEGMTLQASLCEADLNRMLEELQSKFYEGAK